MVMPSPAAPSPASGGGHPGRSLDPHRVRAAGEVTRAVERVRRLGGEIWRLLEAETGLSPSQSAALEAIADGARQVREVADACRQHVSSASRLVDGLVTTGLVSRTADPADRRAVCLTLTDAGRAEAERLTDFHVRMLARILESFTPEDADRLARLMERFADAAEREITEG